jgi:ferritin
MIGKKIEDAFNAQINAETHSAYLYWSMAAYFESVNLNGFATWMQAQAQEEMVHATKFYHFLVERGGRVQLTAIEAPATEWDSPLAAFQAAYKHEQYITGRIHDLVELSAAEKDHAAGIFLQWFVSEQVEEEASADEVVQKLTLMADAPGGLFMLDREMGQRTFSPPPAKGE